MRPNHSVRIIAGEWRGSKLPVPDSDGLRPTGDRVRETLFNWIARRLPGAKCLDAFAGTGALGIEALSRGAASVDAFETDAVAARAIITSLDRLGVKNYRLRQQSFVSAKFEPEGCYDLVFLDPPFSASFEQGLLLQVVNSGLLAEDGIIYLERERRLGPPQVPPGWELLRQKTAGEVWFGLVGPA